MGRTCQEGLEIADSLSLSLSLALLFYVQVAADSGALSLDKVFELIMEGESLPVYVQKEIKVKTIVSVLRREGN
jgi:hypothetical protein